MTDDEENLAALERELADAETRLLEHPTPESALCYAALKRAVKRIKNEMEGKNGRAQ